MITINVKYDNGDTTTTRIDATFEEAKKYYVGTKFNVGPGPEDNLVKCTGIELVEVTQLREALRHAEEAADGDSNDDEIAAWRNAAEMATGLLVQLGFMMEDDT